MKKMGTVVEPHQESLVKALDAIQGTCLIIEEYVKSNEIIDTAILQLWNRQQGSEPLVPLQDLIRTLFTIYPPPTNDVTQLNIISNGITHFFDNITKSKSQSGLVSLDDYKLFLKFFGPVNQSLLRVF